MSQNPLEARQAVNANNSLNSDKDVVYVEVIAVVVCRHRRCPVPVPGGNVGTKSQLGSADHDKALSVDWFNDKLLLILLKK